MAAPIDKRDDIYRYEMMMPFEKKWACYHIPMKAPTPGGYDIIMANSMLGLMTPTKVDESQRTNIDALASTKLWNACEQSIQKSLACFSTNNIELPVQDYLFTILLANSESPYVIMNEGYCGDGGIPGYIMVWLTPNNYTISRLPVAVAHEVNHNIRFQFIEWKPTITLGEMMVSEGLAENFATFLYGDEMTALQNYPPVGLPYCAGYACGYHLVKHYLKKTGKSIVEATLLPAQEILEAVEDFWND